MNAELQWKRLQAQQSTINDQRIQLEDEVRELRGQLEVSYIICIVNFF